MIQDSKRNLISPGSNAQNPLTLGSVGNKPGAQSHPPIQPDFDLKPNGLIKKKAQIQRR
jgi:hypothetical protein